MSWRFKNNTVNFGVTCPLRTANQGPVAVNSHATPPFDLGLILTYLPTRLDNIAVRSPGSTVIIVGTHLDCISPEKYGSDYVSRLKHMVRELVQKPRYQDRVIVPPHGIRALSCAFGGSRAGEASDLLVG
jgi:hypothetical protein